MAFNFNWSPLIADTSRARDMLTTALNKSPKPPIIVDDIVVNELNLGSVPPELEILEVGDLAEDRFRGIFKMSYRGDAFLTLKTRVQANPLNTYLSTKPDFASPQPLAAASGLTIPISITLSDIRLSGFVILVFSRQKGITLVFRNDPLESLKVSSTFDSVPFIANYLQKEIEKQLRNLFMDDLPAIIHRLSVRAFNPEYKQAEEQEKKTDDDVQPVDPLASPPQGPIDGSMMDESETSLFSLDNPNEMHASFSQKNMLRLAALTESQRTLSLFTPSMRDTVFRAWAATTEKGDSPGTLTPHGRPHSFVRLPSSISTSSAWSSTASETSETSSQASRPSLSSFASAASSYSLGTNRSRSTRKRKHRTINLRKTNDTDVSDTASVGTNWSDRGSAGNSAPSITVTEPSSTPAMSNTEFSLQTPPKVANATKVRFQNNTPRASSRPVTPIRDDLIYPDPDTTPRPSKSESRRSLPRQQTQPQLVPAPSYSEKRPLLPRSMSATNFDGAAESYTGGILEQAWIAKIQAENKRKVQWEKAKRFSATFWDGVDEVSPPPAYAM
ncbi:hypothetical protein MBLNU457_7579t1 [Dothideomycetes sp. NU457]